MRSFALHLVVSSSMLAVACSRHDSHDPSRTMASPLAAAIEPGFAAPACLEEAPGCSSGLFLAGPDPIGAELHAPSTLDGAWCSDASLEEARYAVQGITVSTPQGAPMQQSRPIDVEVTVSTQTDEVGIVQLWYATFAESSQGLEWIPIWIDDPYVYPGSPTAAPIRARFSPDQPGTHAVRATVGAVPAEVCSSVVDTDDLVFRVAPMPEALSGALSPEDGSVVTGLVRLALQRPDASLCRVEYVIDGTPEVLVGSVPPFFPAVWDSTPLAEAGTERTVTVRANAFWTGSGSCDDASLGQMWLGQTSLRLAAPASCDAAWGRPTCLAPAAACGSARLVEGARAPGEPVCGGAAVEATAPVIERLLVRSRDGQQLAPGVPARVEVELGGASSLARVDVLFMAVDLAGSGTSQVLGIAEDVGAAVDLGQRVGIDFVVGPSLVRGDPVALQYLMAVVVTPSEALEEEILAFAAPDRTSPIVAVAAPRPGAVVTSPVVLRATARDAGRVESVTFHVDGQPVGTVHAPPYEVSIQLPEGTLSVTAQARDDAGNTGASEVVPVTVDVTPPAVYWRAPYEGAVVHGTVVLSSYAVDPDATPRAAERVELWDGELLLGTLAAPTEWEPSGWPRWDLPWDTTSFASGPHLLRAVAFDRVGLTYEAVLPLLVDQPPTLRLVLPVEGEEATTSIRFLAEVGDDLSEAALELLVDGEVVAALGGAGPGQTTVEYVWTPMTLPPGDRHAAMRACDASRQCVERSAVVHVVDQTPPDVALAAPVAGAVLDGPVVLRVEAWDDVAVTLVEYYVNGRLAGSAAAAPHAVIWDPAPFQGSAVTLVALAYDGAGNRAASEPVGVTVRDTTPPAVSLTSPPADSVLFKSTTFTASASDNVEVDRVEFLLDGAVVASDEAIPWEATLDVRKVGRGTHLLAAIAIDTAGNATTSEATVVRVK